ncbi:3-deoxy-D-manno-octulosonic acid transferase [Paradesertivirga mongoliensis]|uniref:3-deoxy-D-manno-octulosonic acid transferase n=1 Tax=Paradesertivirga mongoliensis TaxID=2100740 RepID=A0ABW4ZGF9_9SPHI|nr:glycosyltransferase N-terminal domain-containing protein [Pedobacter mongoliensis]
MLFLYNLGIRFYHFLIIIYQHFNPKAHLWLQGRKNLFEKISKEVDPNSPSIWFHFASLGEFEQGRPVVECAKESYPAHKIIITFFSPSGYELRKNYKKADHIFYLPLDTNKNAERFVQLINPSLAIFTKYEFWYYFYNELNQRNIPLIVISAIFRESQPFFKWYGGLNRKLLSFVNHFFVQDENSKKLLSGINIHSVTVSGDTRFDRVAENAGNPKTFDEVQSFCADAKVFVAGSTWPEDEKIIAALFGQYPSWKFIIAPHEIKEEKINSLIGMAGSSVRYSRLKNTTETNPQVLIIDNIGMLSALYQYADIAYIGGGFGVGIHNTLEAAAFGVPVIFGPNYQRFREARALIERRAGFTIKNAADLNAIMMKLQEPSERGRAGEMAKLYVETEKGATGKIMEYINILIH